MQKAGFTLLGVGAVVVIAYLCKGFFTDSSVSLLLRIAVGAVGLGLVLLLASVGVKRYRSSKEDKFKGVER